MSTQSRRPRPGPRRILLVGAMGAGTWAISFTAAVITDAVAVSGWLLAPLALGAAVGTVPPMWRYLERHAGGTPVVSILIALWAGGFVAAGAGVAPVTTVRLAAAVAALAAVSAGVAWVVWARHPRELLARGFSLPSARPSGHGFVRTGTVGAAAAAIVASAYLAIDPGADALAVGVALVLVCTASTATLVILGGVRRVLVGDGALRRGLGDAIAGYAPRILVHFSGSIDTLYQLEQWVPFVALSGHRTLVVLREEPVFEASVDRWELPTVMIRDFPDLDLVVVPSVRVVLYVNTGTKNNHLVRFGHLTHVQLHHGESDKPFADSKPMRLYDHHVVAGPVARDRIVAAGLVDAGAVSIVGRPQTAAIRPGPTGNHPRVVLYAPTWEGYHVDTPFSSVAVLGPQLVAAIPTDVMLIVRPHPLTGTVDRSLRRKMSEIRDIVTRRGERGRFVTPDEEPLAETLARSDVLVCDVSSVLVDYLAADRPAIVADAPALGPDAIRSRFPSTSWAAVLAPDLGNLGTLLADALGDDANASRRATARARYLGDDTDPIARFTDVLDALVSAQEGVAR